MPESNILVVMVVIIVSLAVVLFWILSNYDMITKNFFDFLSGAPLLSMGG